MNTDVTTISDVCVAQTESFSTEEWHGVLDRFNDANIFQTPAFATASSARSQLEQFVVRDGPEILAAVQLRMFKVPLLRRPVAYALWGPMWQRVNEPFDHTLLELTLARLREEYVLKRGWTIRLNPCLFSESSGSSSALLERLGYCQVGGVRPGRTIVLNLQPSLEELRKGLEQKWRNCLNRAEKNALTVVEGTEDAMFDRFLVMYRQMLARKRLAEPGDIRKFRAMQSMLPERHKLRVFICEAEGQPCSGAICSAMGATGIYLFGATGDAGLKNKASYLLHWRIIQWLKGLNCHGYDLHGINPETNPGVYGFKSGLSGRNGKEVEFIGSFDAYPGKQERVWLRLADRLNRCRKRGRELYGRFRGFTG